MFGIALLGMVVAVLLGALGLTGSMLLPIGDQFSKKIHYAEPGDIPCPTAGARPVKGDGAKLIVLNTTPRAGLASSVGETLEAFGYELVGTDNAPPYRGNVRIEAGPDGVDDAYTLGRYFGSDIRIVLSNMEGRTLTITLGVNFEGLPPKGELDEIAASNTALIPLQNCLPVAVPEVPQSEQSGQSGQSGDAEETDEPAEEADGAGDEG